MKTPVTEVGSLRPAVALLVLATCWRCAPAGHSVFFGKPPSFRNTNTRKRVCQPQSYPRLNLSVNTGGVGGGCAGVPFVGRDLETAPRHLPGWPDASGWHKRADA